MFYVAQLIFIIYRHLVVLLHLFPLRLHFLHSQLGLVNIIFKLQCLVVIILSCQLDIVNPNWCLIRVLSLIFMIFNHLWSIIIILYPLSIVNCQSLINLWLVCHWSFVIRPSSNQPFINLRSICHQPQSIIIYGQFLID